MNIPYDRKEDIGLKSEKVGEDFVRRLKYLASLSNGNTLHCVYDGLGYMVSVTDIAGMALSISITSTPRAVRAFSASLSFIEDGDSLELYGGNFDCSELKSLMWGLKVLGSRQEADDEVSRWNPFFQGEQICKLMDLSTKSEAQLVKFDGGVYRVKISSGGQNLVFLIELVEKEDAFVDNLGGQDRVFRHYDLDAGRFWEDQGPVDLRLFKKFITALLAQSKPAAIQVIDEALVDGEDA